VTVSQTTVLTVIETVIDPNSKFCKNRFALYTDFYEVAS